MTLRKSLFFGSLLFLSVSVFAQDKKEQAAPAKDMRSEDEVIRDKSEAAEKEKAKASGQQQAGMPSSEDLKVYEAYMTPGPMHKMLAKSVGNWHQEINFWMAPGAPVTKAESNCKTKMILGDRYQESITRGTMMGAPFEGKSTTGYDNSRKVFQSTWIDNMGTGIMELEGPYDEKTKSITLTGMAVDPATGKSDRVREVIKFVNDSTHVMEMYQTKDGAEFKNMEIKFTRIKSDGPLRPERGGGPAKPEREIPAKK